MQDREEKNPKCILVHLFQESYYLYNKCKNQKEKNKIYNEGIKYPFEKLAENVLNTFKFTYFDVPKSDIKKEVVSAMVEKFICLKKEKEKFFLLYNHVKKLSDSK